MRWLSYALLATALSITGYVVAGTMAQAQQADTYELHYALGAYDYNQDGSKKVLADLLFPDLGTCLRVQLGQYWNADESKCDKIEVINGEVFVNMHMGGGTTSVIRPPGRWHGNEIVLKFEH